MPITGQSSDGSGIMRRCLSRVKAATALLSEARAWRDASLEARLAEVEAALMSDPGRVTIRM